MIIVKIILAIVEMALLFPLIGLLTFVFLKVKELVKEGDVLAKAEACLEIGFIFSFTMLLLVGMAFLLELIIQK